MPVLSRYFDQALTNTARVQVSTGAKSVPFFYSASTRSTLLADTSRTFECAYGLRSAALFFSYSESRWYFEDSGCKETMMMPSDYELGKESFCCCVSMQRNDSSSIIWTSDYSSFAWQTPIAQFR